MNSAHPHSDDQALTSIEFRIEVLPPVSQIVPESFDYNAPGHFPRRNRRSPGVFPGARSPRRLGHIVVGTPGRIRDHLQRKTLDQREQMTELMRLRHSCAHILATAVRRLRPDAKIGFGPAIDDGFYYDFEVEKPFTPEDLEAFEAEMHKVCAEADRKSVV